MRTRLHPVDEKLHKIHFTPTGPARTIAAERVVRQVEAHGPRRFLPKALLLLLESYQFDQGGIGSFQAISKLNRLKIEEPDLFDEYATQLFLESFKWVACELPNQPDILPTMAERFFSDMETQFINEGYSLSAVDMARFHWAKSTGIGDADALRRSWLSRPDDETSDCPACTISRQMAYLISSGQLHEAIRLARTQRHTCWHEPYCTNYLLSYAALMTGNPELAADASRQGIFQETNRSPHVEGHIDFPQDLNFAHACHFEALSLGGQVRYALASFAFEEGELLDDIANPLGRLQILLGVLAGLSANLDLGQLPTRLHRSEWATIEDLHTWIQKQAEPLVNAFDKRNGNDMYRRKLEAALSATRVDTPLTGPMGGKQSLAKDIFVLEKIDPSILSSVESLSVGEILSLAEELTEPEDVETAAYLCARAGFLLKSDGQLQEASELYVEAAELLSEVDEIRDVQALFTEAFGLAPANDDDLEQRVRILYGWANVLDDAENAKTLAIESHRLLGRTDLDVELRAQLRMAMVTGLAEADFSVFPEELSEFQDPTRVLSEVTTAAKEFGSVGMDDDAAVAWWSLAELHLQSGDESAGITAFDAALERYAAIPDREQMVLLANDYLPLLRRRGELEKMNDIAARTVGLSTVAPAR